MAIRCGEDISRPIVNSAHDAYNLLILAHGQ
jgi:hypothetical protein